MWCRLSLGLLTALLLGACATTSDRAPLPPGPVVVAPPKTPSSEGLKKPDTDKGDLVEDIEGLYEQTPPPVMVPPDPRSPLQSLVFWAESDQRPALRAFQRTCAAWRNKDDSDPISPTLAIYGTWADWQTPCDAADAVPDVWLAAQQFFEREFLPVDLFSNPPQMGLLTGYYQPEMAVRRQADNVYSEPILALPHRTSDRKKPRSKLSADSARVIAYGRPIDVFFLHVQGSGHITFEDGHRIRAAYAGNNGFPYTSIGGVLVRRGEMTLSEASKQAIEAWMAENGPKAARDLMNENKRYIFFTEQIIHPGEGPKGAKQVPLTAMGSLAVDPRYHPYGVPIWLTTLLPQVPGDYRGVPTGQLVVAQDTGSAIKGPMRGDLFFGSGDRAGGLAGVMKHPAEWTILLPRSLAMRYAPLS